jgi:hypothetical protein
METGTAISIYGAATGTIGTILSVLNRISSNKIRKEDQRIRYQTQSNKIFAICEKFPSLSQQAEHSRQAILIATGAMGGGFERWKQEKSKDSIRINEILHEISTLNESTLTTNQFSSAIIRIDQIFDEANSIQQKYDKSISDDQEKVKVRQSKVV